MKPASSSATANSLQQHNLVIVEMDGIWMDQSRSNMQMNADYLSVLPHEGLDVAVVTNVFQRLNIDRFAFQLKAKKQQLKP